MVSKADFEVGDQISFVYNGGSRPGARRILDVQLIANTCIRGLDHYTKEERAFSYSKMVDVVFLYKVARKRIEISLENGTNASIIYATFYDNRGSYNVRFTGTKPTKYNDSIDEAFYINGILITSLEHLKKVVAAL